ncbi:MAG: ABC transporter permease [Hyphomicrobiaceae bacterium]
MSTGKPPSATRTAIWNVQRLFGSVGLAAHRQLFMQLVLREIAGRYRGSTLGILWSMLTPLLMLGIFTFVFGSVFRSRWAGSADHTSTGDFSVILFTGLIVFQLFSEIVTKAPTLVLSNSNYVKKVVFPLEILAPGAVGSALFHAAVSFAVLLVIKLAVSGSIPLTAFLLPIVLAPLVLLCLGLSWFLSSLGVYYRDINQILGTLVTALMFLSPIFYPISALPAWLQTWLVFNPIALPVEQARNVAVFGNQPHWPPLVIYWIVSCLIAWLGYRWFQKTSKGFADVL